MREILLILSMLVLWLFSAKAFGLYTPNSSDIELLENLERKIQYIASVNPSKIKHIENKIPSILPLFWENSREFFIIQELLFVIQNRENIAFEMSPALVKVLATQFQ